MEQLWNSKLFKKIEDLEGIVPKCITTKRKEGKSHIKKSMTNIEEK